METEIFNLAEIFRKTWYNILNTLPALLIAIIVTITGILIIRYLTGTIQNIISKYSKNSLITDFLSNIINFVLHVVVIMIGLSILGWGSITNKVLAGAGITTFIIGFALKDIGENFLAGMLMAFRRPFSIGDLIEVDKVQGRVQKMTLRETLVKTLDGKDVFVPNGLILKNPMYNYTFDKHLRGDFTITFKYFDDLEALISELQEVVESFSRVQTVPKPSVVLHSVETNNVTLRCLYWYETTDVRAPGGKLKSDILLKVIKTIRNKGIAFTD